MLSRRQASRSIAVRLATIFLFTYLAPAAADDARDVYKQGVSLFDKGSYLEAAAAFRLAYKLKPSWKLLYNIGQCEAAAKRYGHSLVAFESYLVEGGDDIEEERLKEVMQEIERLRPLVGIIEIQAPAGAAVSVNGEDVGTAPLSGPLRLAAKAHRITVTVNGAAVFDKEVTVIGQSTVTVTVNAIEQSPEPAPRAATAAAEPTPPNTPPAPEEERKRSRLFVAAVVTGAVGLAGAGVGGYFIYKGNKDFDAYKEAAAEGDTDKYDDYKHDILPRDKLAVGVSFAAAGVLIATSATLFVIDALGRENDETKVVIAPTAGGVAVSF